MVKHHSDLIVCLKQPSQGIGRLCEKCEGKCPVCDTYVRPKLIIHLCNDCSFGDVSKRCIICGDLGISDAYYCSACVLLEKDRDGCPRVINIGSSRADTFYNRNSKGLKKRY
mmetsp:Transcript_19207/g.27036  ORF Transcript_19207/g.27036 Transcript_19207/m.27036 type:complete len:112 (-) Transcript_19207:2311-2646(-)